MSKKNSNFVQIGKRLKETRKYICNTLREMSNISGFPASTISEMESGRNKPNTEYLLLLDDKFNINLDWIFTGKGAMIKPDFDLKFDFGKDTERILELIYMLENCEFVRHEILLHYLNFKDENNDKIKQYLPDSKK